MKPAKPAPRMAPKRKPPAAVQASDIGMGSMTALPPTMRPTPMAMPTPMSTRSAPPIAGRKATTGTKTPPKMPLPPKMRGR